ncbi:MAG: hypothetical protein IJQ99_10055 [Synergistaceae bacterium]|nr:hypothetical protein [Synergistaceae bacterium]
MSKFTKGKWEVEHGAFDPEIICENKYLAFIYNLEHLEETEANARLIAAAPEMYEWLKTITKIFENGNVINVKDIKELLECIDGEKK